MLYGKLDAEPAGPGSEVEVRRRGFVLAAPLERCISELCCQPVDVIGSDISSEVIAQDGGLPCELVSEQPAGDRQPEVSSSGGALERDNLGPRGGWEGSKGNGVPGSPGAWPRVARP
jgi:hypothetical protein